MNGSTANVSPAVFIPASLNNFGVTTPPAATTTISAVYVFALFVTTPLIFESSTNNFTTSSSVISFAPFCCAILRSSRLLHFAPCGHPHAHFPHYHSPEIRYISPSIVS